MAVRGFPTPEGSRYTQRHIKPQTGRYVWPSGPYGTSGPRPRSQPIRTHRSSSSRSTCPASIKSPAATRCSLIVLSGRPLFCKPFANRPVSTEQNTIWMKGAGAVQLLVRAAFGGRSVTGRDGSRRILAPLPGSPGSVQTPKPAREWQPRPQRRSTPVAPWPAFHPQRDAARP